jgi:hypothetical protein
MFAFRSDLIVFQNPYNRRLLTTLHQPGNPVSKRVMFPSPQDRPSKRQRVDSDHFYHSVGDFKSREHGMCNPRYFFCAEFPPDVIDVEREDLGKPVMRAGSSPDPLNTLSSRSRPQTHVFEDHSQTAIGVPDGEHTQQIRRKVARNQQARNANADDEGDDVQIITESTHQMQTTNVRRSAREYESKVLRINQMRPKKDQVGGSLLCVPF